MLCRARRGSLSMTVPAIETTARSNCFRTEITLAPTRSPGEREFSRDFCDVSTDPAGAMLIRCTWPCTAAPRCGRSFIHSSGSVLCEWTSGFGGRAGWARRSAQRAVHHIATPACVYRQTPRCDLRPIERAASDGNRFTDRPRRSGRVRPPSFDPQGMRHAHPPPHSSIQTAEASWLGHARR